MHSIHSDNKYHRQSCSSLRSLNSFITHFIAIFIHMYMYNEEVRCGNGWSPCVRFCPSDLGGVSLEQWVDGHPHLRLAAATTPPPASRWTLTSHTHTHKHTHTINFNELQWCIIIEPFPHHSWVAQLYQPVLRQGGSPYNRSQTSHTCSPEREIFISPIL